MLHPLQFHPIFQERIWGGRQLEHLFKKPLPEGKIIGESWEISDRDEANSIVANGPLAGKSLRWLMENHAQEMMGSQARPGVRFPLLVKILDAQDKLSLQVHPPAEKAATLGGEPKTEMWYIAHATPEADLYAGLKKGVTREEFESKLKTGAVAECFHRHPVKAGDALFLPSGRVHAIGAGNVIFEIQQNSDTTYRVFDWNRVGLDGKPRDLHVQEALESINFADYEPRLITSEYSKNSSIKCRYLVDDPLFMVNAFHVRRNERFYLRIKTGQVIGVIEGHLVLKHESTELNLRPGDFCFLPAALERVTFVAEKSVRYLQAEARV